MPRKPQQVEIVDTAAGRFVVATFADGEVVRTAIEIGGTPRRKPRRPFARATLVKRVRVPSGDSL